MTPKATEFFSIRKLNVKSKKQNQSWTFDLSRFFQLVLKRNISKFSSFNLDKTAPKK